MKGRTAMLSKMPMDIINEVPEPNMTLIDLEFGVDMAELPEKGKSKKNAVYDTNKAKNADKYRQDSGSSSSSSDESFEGTFDDSSRNRWYEYYKGIGYTTEKLVQMGLTKKVDMAAAPKSLNVKEVMQQLKKQGPSKDDKNSMKSGNFVDYSEPPVK